MSDYEHGQVSRLASILLLGFLLPRSTGNTFFLQQHMSSRNHQATGSSTNEYTQSAETHGDYLLSMPLEERLASTPFEYSSENFGEIQSVADERFDSKLCSFFQNAIAPFLNSRPAHTRQVDLLHILAMAIHPQPSEQPMRKTVGSLGDSQAWGRTRRLMSNLAPHSFHLNYGHRALLARLIAEHLVVPSFEEDQAAIDAPLFEGALPHLRASLYAFGMASFTSFDAHWSQSGLVSIAVQSRQQNVVREEWGRLLNRLMDDRTKYKCRHSKSRLSPSLSFMTENMDGFCPHRARGRLLQIFVCRLGQARHFADGDFLKHALGSLCDAIEFKLDSWTKEEGQSSTTESPCILASLLVAAQPLFCLLLPKKIAQDEEDRESEDNQHRDMLVSCCIQLLHHWDFEISSGASRVLEMAFCYGPEKAVDDYSQALFSSMKLAIEDTLQRPVGSKNLAIGGILAIVSRKCRALGDSMMKFLSSVDRTTPENAHVVDRLIASIAHACPTMAKEYMVKAQTLLAESTTTEASRQHLLSTLLGSRRSYFFNMSLDRDITQYIERTISNSNGWDLYLIGRQALVSGSCAAAKTIFEELSCRATSDTSYQWLSALKRVATAEAGLLNNGAMGIPSAAIELMTATSTVQSLDSLSDGKKASFQLALRLLRLRLDFLDLISLVRQIASEMRLTNIGPKEFTRPSLHLNRSVKLLNQLGDRYLKLYREYGLFICQHSRTAMRTLQALCRFIANATQSTFIEELSTMGAQNLRQDAILALTFPQGEPYHPLTVIMKRFDEKIFKEMTGSVDAKLRAAALLQVIEGILKVPVPFPRSFLVTRPIHPAHYRLYLDADLSEDHGDADDDIDTQIELPIGSFVTFCASGNIPQTLLRSCQLPFYTILVWHTVTYEAIPTQTSKAAEQEKSEDENKSAAGENMGNLSATTMPPATDSSAPPACAISLSPSGRFFVKLECQRMFLRAGAYKIRTHLGCRDIRGGEWELPVDRASVETISIRVDKA